MAWDDDLNDDQMDAASHIGDHACLLSGPGTGKTLCLTRRILYLIEEQDVSPSEIMALTFTRAAAAELRSRVQSELGEDSDIPHISTLHSFALRTILRQFSGSRLPQPIRIADDYEERNIIQEDLKRILNAEKISEVRQMLNQLSSDWETLTADDPDWEQRFPNPAFLGAWREHRDIFGYILRSELVYQLKHAIDEAEIQVAENIRYLLVDEYQDLNACDLGVIERISSSAVELYAAGDDDQSIYGFRYANPDGIRRFHQDYHGSVPLQLRECMRCDRRILDLGLYVARQDPRRLEKDLCCCSGAEDGEVQILRFPDQTREAAGIARICKWLIDEQEIEPQEILILLRSDRHQQFSGPIREALSSRDIPVSAIANPLVALDELEGRHFLCLLRLLSNSCDHLAWRTLLEIRRNGVGERALSNLYDLARDNGQSFHGAIASVSADPSIIRYSGTNIQNEFESISNIVRDIDENDLSDLAEFIEDFATEQIENEDLRSDILRIFLRVLENSDIDDLEQLLRTINVSLENNEQDMESGSINIMTMHQAKGLSADVTFIVAAEDEYVPGKATGSQIGDERRLLYVSLTRARHFLYITHCQRRTGRQSHSGRTSGSTVRNLTQFLSGGPVRSQSGVSYINSL
jgi:DNA helicase II / ATP-dependent DNA helicase PcrA